MKRLKVVILPLMLASIILISSCNKNADLEKLRENELTLLADFINRYETEHDTTLAPTASGLYYIETSKGTGDTIKIGDRVQVWYNTYLLNDTLLVDSNMDGGKYNPLEFYVTAPSGSSVIEGLNEAVKYMQPGGKAFLIIPSEIAYGQTGSYSIPAFSTLLMDVEIYKVYPSSSN